ncbi:GNAT family N-acetyltransferase [Streptomyces candidus]|uniref:RimJ/RimL family protein N-acetyltransferase n=1 Tax=Streptomyces candidus TaxID=67283 RepID=A0A7X0HBQ4_9ACTN|nr:GNAT family N-acetyltransferase [Streptomyces candidus]MBB6434687.1 RimJ/RimL family protein N-acetyltransferase [Streptomyces candidus]GHH35786.1 acetyltransferase [Streptomyces candidus]
MINDIPDVVPAGRMRDMVQPVLALPGGLELRPWRTADAPRLVEARRDPQIRQWNRPAPLSVAEEEQRIGKWARRWRDEAAGIWAVAEPGGGEAVGLVGLGDVQLRHGSGEILYWLLPAARGRGIAVEAAVRLTGWALDDLGLHRVRLTHSTANPASCRVAEKAGFAYEGTMRSALLHADGWHDEHLHARVQGDALPAV